MLLHRILRKLIFHFHPLFFLLTTHLNFSVGIKMGQTHLVIFLKKAKTFHSEFWPNNHRLDQGMLYYNEINLDSIAWHWLISKCPPLNKNQNKSFTSNHTCNKKGQVYGIKMERFWTFKTNSNFFFGRTRTIHCYFYQNFYDKNLKEC